MLTVSCRVRVRLCDRCLDLPSLLSPVPDPAPNTESNDGHSNDGDTNHDKPDHASQLWTVTSVVIVAGVWDFLPRHPLGEESG